MEIVNKNPINETHANESRHHSRFPLKQVVLDTHRFGEYHPHFVLDAVTSDRHVFRSIDNTRSYTLKAPLMQNIQKHMDYFRVPLRAILPMNAARVITNPTLGDDVPVDSYTNVSKFIDKIKLFHDNIVNAIDTAVTGGLVNDALTFTFKDLIFLESIFSHGCLLNSLGCNLTELLRIQEVDSAGLMGDTKYHTIDQVFDAACVELKADFPFPIPVVIDSVSYLVSDIANSFEEGSDIISWHHFLQKIRDTADWTFFLPASASIPSWISYFKDPAKMLFVWLGLSSGGNNGYELDLARCWSYQLCCAEFFSNDKVDYIYSAELFRQYIYSLIVVANGGTTHSQTTFSWNGSLLSYDFLSSHFFDLVVSKDFSSISDPRRIGCLQYFLSLFGYKRSLRFKDYFVGSRTRPLAVVGSPNWDTQIPVVSNNVSVIDVSRSIQVQRFLNAVNATGRKFEEYLKGIFGIAPSPDHHNPLYLAHVTDSIFASEVENTGSDQWTKDNSVTAVFRGNSNKFAFEVTIDEPSFLIGITSYDIERVYRTGIERSFFTKDRYDMFLPDLQYVGDQDVKLAELNPTGNPLAIFGYQFRDMDRKQLVNRAHGGFASGRLPGYAFVYEPHYLPNNLSPDFIRSNNYELDDFYLNLTGYSLATYFHFVNINHNVDDSRRPMVTNPQILG